MTTSAKTAIETTAKFMSGHLGGILERSVGGSQWNQDLTPEFLASLPWTELSEGDRGHAHSDGIDYFFLTAEAMAEHLPNATQNMAFSSGVNPSTIKVRQADHSGFELVSTEVKPTKAQTAWLIVGDHEGTKVVYTAYPGDITPQIPRDFDGELSSLDLNLDFAVKGIN